MKVWIAALMILALAGCGKEITNVPQASHGPSHEAQVDFSDLLRIADDAEILKISTALFSAGRGISANEAEACWARKRSQSVRAACLLLWARSRVRNARLENAIREKLRTPLAAIAAVLQGQALAEWDSTALFTLLDTLQPAPVWIRARAIGQWIEGKNIPLALGRKLVSKLAHERAFSPAEIAESWQVLGRLSPGQREIFLGQHCSHLLLGENWIRCWRFLAIVGFDFDRTILASFLENRLRNDWIYFERNLPRLARQLLP